jgi:hypothetical protein
MSGLRQDCDEITNRQAVTVTDEKQNQVLMVTVTVTCNLLNTQVLALESRQLGVTAIMDGQFTKQQSE